jgi:hypothetical protein
LAPTAKARAKEQKKPMRRMEVPGWTWKEYSKALHSYTSPVPQYLKFLRKNV